MLKTAVIAKREGENVRTKLMKAPPSAMESLVAVDLDHRLGPGHDPAAVHPLGVERCGEVSFGVEGDHPAVASLRREHLHDDRARGFLERHTLITCAGADVVRHHVADEVLPR